MRNPASPYTAMNIEKDYSIALEGQRMQREQIYRAQDEQRKDKEEYDKFSEKIAAGMSQFDKMDIHRNDLDEVQNVEKAARKVVTDALRSHGGDPRAFMRGGGASMLSTYFTQVTASKEYQNAQVSAQTYKLAQAAIEKGQRPNDFNLGTIDDPKYIPFELAVQMHNENKLVDANGNKMPITWAGSFKPMAMNDVLPLLDYVDSPTYRQLDPQEFEGLVRGQGVPDRYARELRAQYESVYYQKNQAGIVSKKNPFSVGPSKERIAEREGAANRAASLAEAKLRATAAAGPTFFPHSQRVSQEYITALPTEKSSVYGAPRSLKKGQLYDAAAAEKLTGVTVNSQPKIVWLPVKTEGGTLKPFYVASGSGGDNSYDPAIMAVAQANSKKYGLEASEEDNIADIFKVTAYGTEILYTHEDTKGKPAKDFSSVGISYDGKAIIYNTARVAATFRISADQKKHFTGEEVADSKSANGNYVDVPAYIEMNADANYAARTLDASAKYEGGNAYQQYTGQK